MFSRDQIFSAFYSKLDTATCISLIKQFFTKQDRGFQIFILQKWSVRDYAEIDDIVAIRDGATYHFIRYKRI